MFRSLMIAALLATATSTQAGKPSQAGTNSPEVVYTLASRKGYELKVANQDGTGAVTLYQSTTGAIIIGKFGPRVDKTIAFYAGSNMYLMTYDTSPTGVVRTSTQLLFNNGRPNAGPFDYSGTDIAWWNGATGDLHIYNLASETDRVLINVPDLAGVSFNTNGSELFYGENKGTGQYLLQRIPVAGGTPTEVGVTTNVGTFDSGHAADNFVIARPVSGYWYVEYVPAGEASGEQFANGIEGSFRCDDKAIIYRRPMANNGYDTLIYDVDTRLSSIFSTNNDVKFASYMPDCVAP